MPILTGWNVRCFILCMAIVSVVFMFSVSATAEALFEGSTFESGEQARRDGWTTWFQRDEIAPDFGVADFPSVGGEGSLMISGASNSAAHGCWVKTVEGIEGGGWYRFGASFAARSVDEPRWKVVARLDWRDADGKRAGRPEYPPDTGSVDGWTSVGGVFQAPENAVGVEIELYLGWADQGTVWWDAVTLKKVDAPPARMVRAATVNCYPRGMKTAAESVDAFCRVADEAGRAGCDIVCLGEGVNLVGVAGAGYADIAEPVPGPTTRQLGEVAKRHGMYIVAALGERDGHAIYNTAVLIDREGAVAGKYRKVQLPREEIEAGVTPGSSWPVFDTDFGRIGMMVCWDNQYAEPARALAIQGAEMILMPIWGGNETLTKARAIENQVHVVSCGYSMPGVVYDPWGNVLAEAKERPGIAWADIDLNKIHPEPWLGNMRHRFFRELRTDIPVPGLR